jgi:hypothetical protein
MTLNLTYSRTYNVQAPSEEGVASRSILRNGISSGLRHDAGLAA